MTDDLLRNLRRLAASTAITPSTIQKMGPSGMAAALRRGLSNIDVSWLHSDSEEQFASKLNDTTAMLMAEMSEGVIKWGTARKVLNIFLIKYAYNRHLYEYHQISKMKRWFEVPLDSNVAAGLALDSVKLGVELSEWGTVVGLSAENSEKYQAFAKSEAERRKIFRYDLDSIYYRTLAKQ